MKLSASQAETEVDVVIVGAGIAGINAAYRLQTECPRLSYTILERRHDLGGTWSFFKYPGIRSDSDLYTMGFAWHPWEKSNPIADGPSIVDYVRATAAEHGIDKHIKYSHDVLSMDWRSASQQWDLTAGVEDGATRTYRSRFLIAGTGFFDYKQPRATTIPGLDSFKGTVVHPQFWSDKVDYADKKVVVVGSGATAITIVPAVAQTAAKTIMLQRSPSYILSIPMHNALDERIRNWLPHRLAHTIIRWRYAILAWLFFYFAVFFPVAARSALEKAMRKELPAGVEFEPHFKPTYGVWDQRVCVCPDGDFYKSLEKGKAEVVTDKIKTVTESGIELESGRSIGADIIVTATGLKLQMLGGARMSVDGGEPIDVGKRFMWRGTMLQDVPNALVVVGYFNNSWTLGADLAVRIFVKKVKEMERLGATSFAPKMTAAEESLTPRNLWSMTSTYLQNEIYPRGSDAAPWSVKDNYLRDWFAMGVGDLSKGLVYTNAPRK